MLCVTEDLLCKCLCINVYFQYQFQPQVIASARTWLNEVTTRVDTHYVVELQGVR